MSERQGCALSAADAAEEVQALAAAGWTITVWHEPPRARRGPLAAKGPTFVVEAGGVTGYDDEQAGEGATLAEAVSALVDRLRAAYPDDDAPEEHTTQGAPLAAVPDGLRERLAALAHTQWSADARELRQAHVPDRTEYLSRCAVRPGHPHPIPSHYAGATTAVSTRGSPGRPPCRAGSRSCGRRRIGRARF